MRRPVVAALAMSLVLALLAAPSALGKVEKIEAGAVFAKAKSGPAVKILAEAVPTSKVLSTPNNGTRLPYRKKIVGSDGRETWYFVVIPGRAPGWVAANDTSPTRPEAPPPPRMIVPVDSGITAERPTASQTAAARGLSDSAKRYASEKQGYVETVNEFLTLEKTVEEYFDDPHDEIDGSYPDVTVEGRKKKAQQFRATLK